MAHPRNLVVVVLFSLLLGPLAAQAPRRLFTSLASADVDPVAQRWADAERRSNRAVVAQRFVQLDAGVVHDLRCGGTKEFAIDLHAGAQTVVAVTRTDHVLGHLAIRASLDGGADTCTMALARDGTVAATIQHLRATYALVATNVLGVHVLQTIDASRLAAVCPECATDVDRAVSAPGHVVPAPALDPTTTLDVAVFYTPLARQAAGSNSAIEVQIINAMALANATCGNSSVQAAFRLVHLAETAYVEDGSARDHDRFWDPRDGFMDEVHTARARYGADLMHLVTQPATLQYCGIAFLMTTLSTGFADYAFAVTVRSCLVNNTLAHEMGHNMGCHHDRAYAGGAIYPYAYGYRTADNVYRTTMAYPPGTRVPFWSSPAASYQGYTLGIADGEDNARTLTNTKATVAAFRATRVLEWCPLAGGVAGAQGEPVISGRGTVDNFVPIEIEVTNFRAGSVGAVVLGGAELNVPFAGGVIVPTLDVALTLFGSAAPIIIPLSGIAALPPQAMVYAQCWFLDATGPAGWAASDGIKTTVP